MARDSKFSPFATDFDSLTSNDLQVLRGVVEGWYVEYKERLPSASSIAKSIGAFANTHGGFLFFGIKEQSKENPVAGEFPGVSGGDVAAALMQIRQSVAAHLSPVPHFEVRVINGPSPEIDLDAGQAIICVEIPWSPEAPHVHKSGVIFRRVADSSEPKAENDRYVLDELFKRSEKRIEQVREWVNQDPTFEGGEENSPYLRVLLTTDPYGQRRPWLTQSFKELREVLCADGAITPFDSIYTTSRGLVGRQTLGNDPATLSMTMFIDRDLTAEAIVPLPLFSAANPSELERMLEGYDHSSGFIEALDAWGFNKLQVLDMNQLLPVLQGIFQAYHRMLNFAGWKEDYSALMKPLNLSRVVPFFDVESVIASYQINGVPVFLKKCALNLDHGHPKRFLKLEAFDAEAQAPLEYANGASCLVWFATDIGVSVFDADTDFLPLLDALDEAGRRSNTAQRLRNDRNKDLR